jgi:hypothetical protein
MVDIGNWVCAWKFHKLTRKVFTVIKWTVTVAWTRYTRSSFCNCMCVNYRPEVFRSSELRQCNAYLVCTCLAAVWLILTHSAAYKCFLLRPSVCTQLSHFHTTDLCDAVSSDKSSRYWSSYILRLFCNLYLGNCSPTRHNDEVYEKYWTVSRSSSTGYSNIYDNMTPGEACM